MKILHRSPSFRTVPGNRGLLRLMVAATILTLASFGGAVVHADEPAAGAAATAVRAGSAVETGADRAVPLADTVALSLAASKPWSTTCMAQAAVSFAGQYPLSGYEVTFEVVAGPHTGWTSPRVLSVGPAGVAKAPVPRPLVGSQSNVIRATLHSYKSFVSIEVPCLSGEAAPATSVAILGNACPPTPQPC